MKKIFLIVVSISFIFISFLPAQTQSQGVPQNENPDISAIIDTYGLYDFQNTQNNKLYFRYAGLMFMQALTPWFAGTLIFTKPGDEDSLEAEEIYGLVTHLPLSTLIEFGQFHTDFGYINKLHKHQLPTFNHPNILYYIFNSAYPDTNGVRSLVSDEPNNDVGISVSTLLPVPFYSELEFNFLDGNNETIFQSGEGTMNTYLMRLKNYWDLSARTGLDLWFSGMRGPAPIDGDITYVGNGYLGLKIRSKALPEFQYLKLDSEVYYRTLIGNKKALDTLTGYYVRLMYAFRILYQHSIGVQYSSVIPDSFSATPLNNTADVFFTTLLFRNTEFKIDWNADLTDTQNINQSLSLECTLTLGPHRHLL